MVWGNVTDWCAESFVDGADKGKGAGMRKALWVGGELWVNDEFGGNLCGGDATWCSISG